MDAHSPPAAPVATRPTPPDFAHLPRPDGGLLSVRPAHVVAVESKPERQDCLIHLITGDFMSINTTRAGVLRMLAGDDAEHG